MDEEMTDKQKARLDASVRALGSSQQDRSRFTRLQDEVSSFPKNAVSELFMSAPATWEKTMRAELRKIDKVSFSDCDDETVIWPNRPYHYGMGRIREYSSWFDTLNEKDQQTEIAASRIRYEIYYQTLADVLIERMKDLGYNLTPHRPTQTGGLEPELEFSR